MNCTQDQVLRVVAEFVARTRSVPVESVKADTKLFQEGLVDSFAVVELTAELEKMLSARLGDGTLLPEDFETPKVLFERLRDV